MGSVTKMIPKKKNKNIAIKPSVYDKLVILKRGKDTFTDVIERELNKAAGCEQ